MSNPWEGFVFRAESCSRNCCNGKRCNHCASKINEACHYCKHFEESCIGGDRDLHGVEEIRRLRCELARTVLLKEIEKDGTVLPDGAAGDQIRRAVGIMDGPVTEALQLGAALEALEIWRVHTEHINREF
jgi:hypothetical protein